MNATTPLPAEETSQSLGGGAEVTVLMPIKKGFVPHRDTLTYASRLHRVLRTFNLLRKASLESSLVDTIAGAVERIQTVTAFNWAVVENETKLLLNVVFDRPWEPYIRKIARDAGPMLDLILCNCEGYVEGGYSTDNGYPKFAEWVRKHQIGVDFLYTSHSFSTTDDQRYYEELDQLLHGHDDPAQFDLAATGLRASSPAESANRRARANPKEYAQQVAGVVGAFYGLREYFPGKAKPFPATDSRDQWFLNRVAHALLDPIPGPVLGSLRSLFPSELEWFDAFAEKPSPAETPYALDLNNIQGNILEGYRGVTDAMLLLIRLGESREHSLAFLRSLPVTTAARAAESDAPDEMLNLLFTIDGLRRLSLRADWIAKLPKEFRDGMEARAGLLGDVRLNHPQNWKLPIANGPLLPGNVRFRVPMQSVDIAVLLQRKGGDENRLKASVEEFARQAKQHGADVLYVEPMRRSDVEQFGYRDGISNPLPHGKAPSAAPVYSDQVPIGEFLLGYPNRHGDLVEDDPPLKDGSFMVVRKLKKDTEAFEKLVKGFGDKWPAVGADLAKAKLMGRHLNGTPLVKGAAPNQATNDFNFAGDEKGEICPFQAHIRRANPRSAAGNTSAEQDIPRIARRGFSYGPNPDGEEKGELGAMFMAYNASIAEQFEIIQRWMSGGNSTGISSREADPLLGVPKPGEKRSMRFQHEGKVYRIDLGAEPLVTLKWGLYLFCPSISLIERISKGELDEKNPGIETLGAQVIKGLMAPPRSDEIPPGGTPDQIIAARWKAFLESDLGPRAPLVNAVWAAIRKDFNGILRTPYGVLVAGADQVRAVLADDGQRYSVRENWDRMQRSIVETYLGIDRCPANMSAPVDPRDTELEQRYLAACPVGKNRFDDEATLSKPPVAEVSFEDAYEASFKLAQKWLTERLQRPKIPIRLPELFGHVLAELARLWFGMPDGNEMVASATPTPTPEGAKEKAACPFHFFAVSKYVFPPMPTPFVHKEASDNGSLIRDAARRFVEKARSDGNKPGTLLSPLYDGTHDDAFIARTIITLLNGFVAPTFANFLTIMHRWIESKELAREYHRYRLASDSGPALRTSIERALPVKCTPSTVNRTVVSETTLDGSDLKLRPGEQLVVGLQSAVDERRFAGQDGLEFVFGGYYRDPQSPLVHACPGKDMAIGTMAGALGAIFDAHLITNEGAPLTLLPNPPTGA